MIHWIAISTNLIFKLIIKCCIVYIIDGVSHRLFDILLLLLECRPWLVRMTSSSGCSWPRTNRGYTETSCPWILSKRWGARGDWWCYTWDGYNVENEKPKFNLILILGLSSAVLSACIPYFQKLFTGLHLGICKLCFVSVKYHFKFNLIRVVLNKNNLSQVSKLFKYLLFVFYMYYYLVHLCTVYDTGLCTMLRLNSLPLLSY